ncbi:hypothetical protein [uncultured Brachyspira sp.]|uniref:hypothetical protein n=1 Tax=uncultured Brachyspira sp. TaxID=221953 RepID=UPI00262A9A86|nr:hypothetical protein [uncultured Brachyspira sp.]
MILTENTKYLRKLAKKIRAVSFNVKVDTFMEEIKYYKPCIAWIIVKRINNVFECYVTIADKIDNTYRFDSEMDLIDFLQDLYETVFYSNEANVIDNEIIAIV